MSRNRLFAGSALAVAALLSVSACGSSANSSAGAQVKTVLLANVEDLTGPASVYGIPESNGAQLAVRQINAAGGIKSLGGARLVLKKFDTASNVDAGVTQAQAAVNAGAAAVVGGEISDTVLAGTNVTQRAGIPWLDTGATASKIHQRGDGTVFEVTYDSAQFETAVYDTLEEATRQLGIGSPTLAIPYSQSSYGQESLQAFLQANSGKYKVRCEFSYPLTTTDFSSVATRAAACGATDIVNLGYPTDGVALSRLFATQFHPRIKVWAATGMDPGTAISQLGSAANGALTIAAPAPDEKGVTAAFDKEFAAYRAQFHATPTVTSWAGYAAVHFIAAALERAGSTSGAKLTAALHRVTLTQGDGDVYSYPGTLSFTAQGTLRTAPAIVAEIQNDKIVPVWPPAYDKSPLAAYPF